MRRLHPYRHTEESMIFFSFDFCFSGSAAAAKTKIGPARTGGTDANPKGQQGQREKVNCMSTDPLAVP
jgi:hypothetical protein